MKRLLIAIILICSISSFSAQQESIYSMFWNNVPAYNPGAAGVDYKHQGYNLDRSQWVGFPDHPITGQLAYFMRTKILGGGIGYNFTYDQLGFEKNYNSMFNYSYHLKLKKDRKLGIGIGLGMQRKTIQAVWVTPSGTSPINDPSIPSTSTSRTFDMSSGLYYKGHNLNGGISLIHITQSSRSLVGYFAYNWELKEEKIMLTPSVYAFVDKNGHYVIGNLMLTMMEKVQLGVGYNSSELFNFSLGYNLKKKYRIAYCYEMVPDLMRKYSHGTHEIVLALLFK